jgi:hypothetical protein
MQAWNFDLISAIPIKREGDSPGNRWGASCLILVVIFVENGWMDRAAYSISLAISLITWSYYTIRRLTSRRNNVESLKHKHTPLALDSISVAIPRRMLHDEEELRRQQQQQRNVVREKTISMQSGV